jgi:DNA repair photolyase
MGEEKAKYTPNPLFSSDLLPIFGQRPEGIARMAAEGHPADSGRAAHGVAFRTIETRSILNRVVSKRMHYFQWAINPYRGCEFGCRYCYARYTHEFLDKTDPLTFEREIYIKQHAAWLLRQELRHVGAGETIAIGTATDPYQPIERTARVTQSLLDVLSEREGLKLGLVTKSTLIERDIDLLKTIAAKNDLSLCVTITTPDTKLARVLEPRAPRPDLRFQTVERLREAGLRVGILCSPMMPGITDTPQALERMAIRAKKARACFFASQPLFLKPCSKAVFLRFVEEHFPALVPAYAQRYGQRDFVSKAYQERVAALVRAIVRKYSLDHRFAADRKMQAQPVWPMQGELWAGLQRRTG